MTHKNLVISSDPAIPGKTDQLPLPEKLVSNNHTTILHNDFPKYKLN